MPRASRSPLFVALVALAACHRVDPEGRLAVRFVIGADGVLSFVVNGGTDLPDGRTVQCLLDTLRGLLFPRPEAGIVTVVYPIVLEPPPRG